MNKLLLIANIIFFLAFFSCTNTASSVKSNIDNIVIDAEKNYKNYSEDDWHKKDEEIEKLTTKFSENRSKYTPKQIEDINNLFGRYKVVKLKKLGNEFAVDIKDAIQQSKGVIEALIDTTN